MALRPQTSPAKGLVLSGSPLVLLTMGGQGRVNPSGLFQSGEAGVQEEVVTFSQDSLGVMCPLGQGASSLASSRFWLQMRLLFRSVLGQGPE